MNKFESVRSAQWVKGQKEYGNLYAETDDRGTPKLSDDQMHQMFMEELADVANYAMMTAVRLMLWEEAIHGGSADSSVFTPTKDSQHQVSHDFGPFAGHKDVSGFRPIGNRPQDSG